MPSTAAIAATMRGMCPGDGLTIFNHYARRPLRIVVRAPGSTAHRARRRQMLTIVSRWRSSGHPARRTDRLSVEAIGAIRDCQLNRAYGRLNNLRSCERPPRHALDRNCLHQSASAQHRATNDCGFSGDFASVGARPRHRAITSAVAANMPRPAIAVDEGLMRIYCTSSALALWSTASAHPPRPAPP